jgi:hypothetical protein
VQRRGAQVHGEQAAGEPGQRGPGQETRVSRLKS